MVAEETSITTVSSVSKGSGTGETSDTTIRASNVEGTEREYYEEAVEVERREPAEDKSSLSTSDIMKMSCDLGKDALKGIGCITYGSGARSDDGDDPLVDTPCELTKATSDSQFFKWEESAESETEPAMSVKSTSSRSKQAKRPSFSEMYEDHEAQTLEIVGVKDPKVKNIRSTKPFKSPRSSRVILAERGASKKDSSPQKEDLSFMEEEHEAQSLEIVGVKKPKIRNYRSTKPFQRSSRTLDTEQKNNVKPENLRKERANSITFTPVHEDHEAQALEIFGVEKPKVKNICSVKPFKPRRASVDSMRCKPFETSKTEELPVLRVRGTLLEI